MKNFKPHSPAAVSVLGFATALLFSACTPQQETPDAAGSQPSTTSNITGTLTCGPVGEWSGFEQSLDLVIEGNTITTKDGGVEPANASRFETWSGRVEGERVEISGRYKQAEQKPGPVSLSGSLVDGQLRLEGMRGPRKCSYASAYTEPGA